MKSTISICFSLILFISVISAHASADTEWTKVGFTGGDVTDMASFPVYPDIVLACVKNHGLYRSADRGESWSRVLTIPCNDLSISEQNVVFAAGEAGLLVSYNYGLNWLSCTDSAASRVVTHGNGVVAFDPHSSSTSLPWFLSFDNGNTWAPWDDTERSVSFLFHQTGAIYRSADLNIYKCDPYDWNVWTLVKDYQSVMYSPDLRFGFSDYSVMYAYSRYIDLHPVGSRDGGVFRSTDNGATWVKYTDARSVSVLERSNKTIIIGEVNGTLSTATTTSEDRTIIGEFGCEITAIDAARFDSGELIVATRGGIFKTTDGGAHWRKSGAGIMRAEVVAVQVIPVGDGGERIIVSTKRSGVFYSNDNGEHWVCADPDVHTVPGLLRASGTDRGRIYAAEASIDVSYDSGETWKRIPDELPLSYYGWYGRTVDIDIDPTDVDRIVVNFDDHSLDHRRGIFNIDGRRTGTDEFGNDVWQWESRNLFEDAYPFHSQFSGDGAILWTSREQFRDGMTDPPLKAIDSHTGEPVQSIALPDDAESHIWLIDGQECYLFDEKEGRFWISSDLGETWNYTDLTLEEYVHYDLGHTGPLGEIVQSPDKETLYLIYPGNGVLMSGDRGQSWEYFNAGLDNLLVYQLAFSPADSSVIYAATGNGLYRWGAPPDIVRVDDSITAPHAFSVSSNYPNPFNASTVIDYHLATGGDVRIDLYDVTGRKVRTLAGGFRVAGTYRVTIDGDDLASGMYFCRFSIANAVETRRIVLLK